MTFNIELGTQVLWAAAIRLVTLAILGLQSGEVLARSNYPGKITTRSFVDRSRPLITRIMRIAKNGVC